MIRPFIAELEGILWERTVQKLLAPGERSPTDVSRDKASGT